jgi:hypothetical protein
MFEFDSAVLELKQRLLLLENSKTVSTQTELAAVRCPLCGDSDNIRHAHLYIGVKEYNNRQLVMYDCKKCGRQGLVTPQFLRRLNIFDINIDTYLKSVMKGGAVRTYGVDGDLSGTAFRFPSITKADKEKIDYLSNRLQLNFSDIELIKKYKIILNFAAFLNLNHIENPSVSRNKISYLSDYGIGFLGEDKKSVSIRNMDPGASHHRRFSIIHLFSGPRRPFMYIPPCNVDVLSISPRIVVSESAFNIICCKNYFYSDDDTGTIYGASARKIYVRPITRLIQLSGFVNGQIDIYPDNDDDFNVEWYQNHLSRFTSNFDVTLYVNTESNDFGNMPKAGERFEYEVIRL